MTHCPICKDCEATLHASYAREKLVTRWKQSLTVDIAGELIGLDPVTEWLCPRCRLQFFPPTGAGSAELYEQLCRFPWYYMPDKWEHAMAVADVRSGDRVLEVGCGAGAFLRRLRTAGWDASGLELNPLAVAQAQAAGLPVSAEMIGDVAAARPEAYDFVCSFQVLEHVADPFDFIDQQVRVLKPGGRLAIGVPNQDSYIKHEDNLLNLPPHHISRWSARSLQNLTKVFPLSEHRMATEPLQKYHISGYARVMMEPLRRFALPGRAAARALGGVTALALTQTGWHRRLMGQTIYACFEKRNTSI